MSIFNPTSERETSIFVSARDHLESGDKKSNVGSVGPSLQLEYLTPPEQVSTLDPDDEAADLCDICGVLQAEVICTVCDGKQLCVGCDEKWHLHPRRVNHTRSKMHSDKKTSVLTPSLVPGVPARMTAPYLSGISSQVLEIQPKVFQDVLPVPIPSEVTNRTSLPKLPVFDEVFISNQDSVLLSNAQRSSNSPRSEYRNFNQNLRTQEPNNAGKPQQSYDENNTDPPRSEYKNTNQNLRTQEPNNAGKPQQSYDENNTDPPRSEYKNTNQNQRTTEPSKILKPLESHDQNTASSVAFLKSISAVELEQRTSRLMETLNVVNDRTARNDQDIQDYMAQDRSSYHDDEYKRLDKKKWDLFKNKKDVEQELNKLRELQSSPSLPYPCQQDNQSPHSSPRLNPGSNPQLIQTYSMPQPVPVSPHLAPYNAMYSPYSPMMYHYPALSVPASHPVLLQNMAFVQTPQNLQQTSPLWNQQPLSLQMNNFIPPSRFTQPISFMNIMPKRSPTSRQDPHIIHQLDVSSDELFPMEHDPRTFEPLISPNRVGSSDRQTLFVPGKLSIPTKVAVSKESNAAVTLAYPPGYIPKTLIKSSVIEGPNNIPFSPSSDLFTDQSQTEWACQSCTFINNINKKSCQMCEMPRPTIPEMEKPKIAVQTSEATAVEHETEQKPKVEVGSKVKAYQDQIYLEKMSAQKKFQEENNVENETKNEKEINTPIAKPRPSRPAPKLPKPAPLTLPRSAPLTLPRSAPLILPRSGPTTLPRLAPPTQPKPTPPTMPESAVAMASTEDTTPTPTINDTSQQTATRVSNEAHSEQKLASGLHHSESPKSSLASLGMLASGEDFALTMNRINAAKHINTLYIDGSRMLKLVKDADRLGFEVEDMEAVLHLCEGSYSNSVEWLKANWTTRIENVVTKAAKVGQNLMINYVDKLSKMEAKESLRSTSGDEDKAVELCISTRKQKWDEITKEFQLDNMVILDSLLECEGNVKQAADILRGKVLERYGSKIWDEQNDDDDDDDDDDDIQNLGPGDLYGDASNKLEDQCEFVETVKNKDIDVDRRIRMVLAESRLRSWGRANLVIKLLDNDLMDPNDPLDWTLDDVIEAVNNFQERDRALAFLQQECSSCYSRYPMRLVHILPCQCYVCTPCFKQYFELSIREKHVRNWTCPACNSPDIDAISDQGDEYFSFIHLLLKQVSSDDIMQLFVDKLRDRKLQGDPNFRWCAHCAFGFIYTGTCDKMTCTSCRKYTCFKCRKQFEPQHEGITCEEFERWKVDNDVDNQAMGLARHLEENGIDCPKCKMRYDLAKGGCMHFICPECGFEFCSGCSQQFFKDKTCMKYKRCVTQGFHSHHPRDCFFYLRDQKREDLQRLLTTNNVEFNKDVPAGQEASKHCPVLEQKDSTPKDEACGRAVKTGTAGLCEKHYKEYLVALINNNKLDPVPIMSKEGLHQTLERVDKPVPNIPKQKGPNASAEQRKKLEEHVKQVLPLER